MAAPKGFRPSNAGKGRVKGSVNRSTQNARDAIAKFVDDNTPRLQSWLDQIAEDDPLAAMRCVTDLLEYHVPKLQRTELTGPDGGAVIIQSTPADDRL